jgi:hypothetical protein
VHPRAEARGGKRPAAAGLTGVRCMTQASRP